MDSTALLDTAIKAGSGLGVALFVLRWALAKIDRQDATHARFMERIAVALELRPEAEKPDAP